MPRYLIVAHQTAESPELVECVRQLIDEDASSIFSLLVPATPVQHLLTWWEGEKQAIARESAMRAIETLEDAGARVGDAVVGDATPMQALQDELRRRPNYYQAIIICTFPAGLSRWLQLDFPSQARRTCDLPVIHVEAEPARVRVSARR